MALNPTLYRTRNLEANTSPEFRRRLVEIAHELGLDPTAIASVMAIETGGTYSPSIQNPNGGAVGLIQFIPSTARQLGTSTEALKAMTAVEQLEYVKSFFARFGTAIREPRDHYMATAAPNFIGAADDAVVYTGKTAAANPGLDINKDGSIQAGEIYSVFQPVYNAAIAAGPASLGGSSSRSPGSVRRHRRKSAGVAVLSLTFAGIGLLATIGRRGKARHA